LTAKQVTKQSGRVTTEGDELYYEVCDEAYSRLQIATFPALGSIKGDEK
jgi:hypothetical protein